MSTLSGEAIRIIRVRKGWSQEQFAFVLGVTFSTVNRWENGHASPSKAAVARILEIREMSAEDALAVAQARFEGQTRAEVLSGEEVRTLRERLGLTQEEFAHALHVTVSTINRWENGHADPSPLLNERLLELSRGGRLETTDEAVQERIDSRAGIAAEQADDAVEGAAASSSSASDFRTIRKKLNW